MKFRVYLLACLIIPSSLWAKITEVKYSYDKLGRLSSVVYASNERANEFYTYDEQGNLAEKKIGEISCTYKYDKANQLTSFNGPEGERTYKYDKAGRLLEEYLNGELDVSYKYGYLDKVIEINRKGKVTKFKYCLLNKGTQSLSIEFSRKNDKDEYTASAKKYNLVRKKNACLGTQRSCSLLWFS